MKIYKFPSKKIEQQLNSVPKDFTLYTIEELGDFYKGKGISRSEIRTDGIACVTYGSIYTTHNEVIGSIETFISDDTTDNSFLLQSGDILFTGSGETQEEIGKASAYLNAELCYAGGDIIVLRPNPVVDSRYLAYLFNSYLYHIQRMRLGQGYSVVHIQSDHIKSIIVPIPSLLEQKKIADILSTWDDAINTIDNLLHQYEKQYESTVSKILRNRSFGNFDGNWEEISLGKVIEEVSNKTNIDNQYQVLTSSRKGIFLQQDYFNKIVSSKSNKGYKIIKKGEFTFRAMSDDGNFKFNRLEDYEIGIVSPAYSVFKAVNIEPRFLNVYMNSHLFTKEIAKASQGGTRLSLKYKALSNFKITIPDYETQHIIAEFCDYYQNHIKKLEKYSELLKIQKQGLMQQLLTGKIRVNVN